MPRKPKLEKVCTGCGKLMPRSAFSPGWINAKTGTIYRRGKCKACRSFQNSQRARLTKRQPSPEQMMAMREACRRYRARIFADPERYAAHRDAENARIKAYRLKKALKKHRLLGKGRAK